MGRMQGGRLAAVKTPAALFVETPRAMVVGQDPELDSGSALPSTGERLGMQCVGNAAAPHLGHYVELVEATRRVAAEPDWNAVAFSDQERVLGRTQQAQSAGAHARLGKGVA